MMRFSYCEKCGEAVPIFENGLCARCFAAELDAKRTDAPRKPPRPSHINSGLGVCEVCGIRAASVLGKCVGCYRRARYKELSPEQLEARKAKKRAADERRKAKKRATDKLI